MSAAEGSAQGPAAGKLLKAPLGTALYGNAPARDRGVSPPPRAHGFTRLPVGMALGSGSASPSRAASAPHMQTSPVARRPSALPVRRSIGRPVTAPPAAAVSPRDRSASPLANGRRPAGKQPGRRKQPPPPMLSPALANRFVSGEEAGAELGAARKSLLHATELAERRGVESEASDSFSSIAVAAAHDLRDRPGGTPVVLDSSPVTPAPAVSVLSESSDPGGALGGAGGRVSWPLIEVMPLRKDCGSRSSTPSHRAMHGSCSGVLLAEAEAAVPFRCSLSSTHSASGAADTHDIEAELLRLTVVAADLAEWDRQLRVRALELQAAELLSDAVSEAIVDSPDPGAAGDGATASSRSTRKDDVLDSTAPLSADLSGLIPAITEPMAESLEPVGEVPVGVSRSGLRAHVTPLLSAHDGRRSPSLLHVRDSSARSLSLSCPTTPLTGRTNVGTDVYRQWLRIITKEQHRNLPDSVARDAWGPLGGSSRAVGEFQRFKL
eukprot:TRINITY_DN13629_c0_g1_i2.p2 TRINITY_DN13629_c0_g1~~TRINITY_DN13629_c0_g1_i2.p2  ORF type:complete len:494 (+),score=142.49 TRINITY_DN13629_c0_g1_i2:17-1498(+)